jgi:DNA-binding GntR family transcriptional regulator
MDGEGGIDEAGARGAATERTAEALRDMVIRGALKPGEHLVERRLCAALGVSRTPMREALKLLAHDGLVDLSPHRGARVAPYDSAEAGALFEVIAALEGLAACALAQRVDAATLGRLEALHAAMHDHFRAGRLDAYFDVNSAIHDAVIEAAGNPVLAESHRRLMLQARRGRYMAIMDAERWRQAIGEHDLLMAALRVGDAAAARAVWERHLRNTGASVAAALAGGAA